MTSTLITFGCKKKTLTFWFCFSMILTDCYIVSTYMHSGEEDGVFFSFLLLGCCSGRLARSFMGDDDATMSSPFPLYSHVGN